MTMALSLTIPPSKPNPLASSFLPPLTATSTSLKPTTKSKSRTAAITCSSAPASKPKIVRCPSLDRHAASHNRLRFVRKLTTLLLSKPRHFLPLRVLSRCRPYLSLPPRRSILSTIHRYPSIFRLLHTPSFTSPTSVSLLSVSLTPAAESLFSHISRLRSTVSDSLADKLHRLLLLSSHPRLLLSKLVHIAPDLGLPPDFRSRLCNSHPRRFRTVPTSYGTALELVANHHDAATTTPVTMVRRKQEEDWRNRPIIDRPPKFKQVRLRRGLNVKRRHLEYLIRFQESPEINPYTRKLEGGMTAEEKERRACAVVREVLGMTVEKRTLVDHLTHFRKEFGLPNKLRGMLVRHPELFYVSIKGQRDSVFLVEAYDDKGRLVEEDELLVMKERLEELVREGTRMRRERKRGIGLMGNDKNDSDEEEEEEEVYYEDDDVLGDLFESGIGGDWEDFGDGEGRNDDDDDGDGEGKEIVEFWSLKSTAETSGNEAW